MEKIMVVGDIHGQFDALNDLIREQSPDKVFVLGDFGYYCPKPLNMLSPLSKRADIYFIDGNHDNTRLLGALHKSQDYALEPIQLDDGLFYLPRGTRLNLNGYEVMFMGGAESIDGLMNYIEGVNWFPEEGITLEDLERITHEPVDMIMSHTAPDFIIRYVGGEGGGQSEIILRAMYNKFKPKHWYFGHMHRVCKKKSGKVQFHGLNTVPKKHCWEWLAE